MRKVAVPKPSLIQCGKEFHRHITIIREGSSWTIGEADYHASLSLQKYQFYLGSSGTWRKMPIDPGSLADVSNVSFVRDVSKM